MQNKTCNKNVVFFKYNFIRAKNGKTGLAPLRFPAISKANKHTVNSYWNLHHRPPAPLSTKSSPSTDDTCSASPSVASAP